METLWRFWDFLDGRKTAIGAAIILLGKAVNYFGYAEYGNPIQAFGTAFATFGLAHKAVK
jgi:hypothetical protein